MVKDMVKGTRKILLCRSDQKSGHKILNHYEVYQVLAGVSHNDG